MWNIESDYDRRPAPDDRFDLGWNAGLEAAARTLGNADQVLINTIRALKVEPRKSSRHQ